MKALTIRQPWGTAITLLGKTVENRTWTNAHRGRIAIHAGAGTGPRQEYEDALETVAARSGLEPEGVARLSAARGAVIAVADLVDICTIQVDDLDCSCDCGPWAAFDQCHWKLANVQPLAEPVPVKGALGLWTLPADVEAAVLAQLGQEVSR